MSDEKIYIYHTNDIHSRLTYWPRIAKALAEKRSLHEEKGNHMLTFDIGDAMDRVHPLAEATDGQAITELLNEGAYDAVTIGNNEGITNSKKQLNHLYDEAEFTVVLANLFDSKTKKRPQWAKPYDIFKTEWGDRIGVFGLTAPFQSTYQKLGWQVTNPIKQTQDFFKKHSDKADFWILLSHLGLNQDRFLAKLFPLPLIIGGHTHHSLINGEIVAGSTLAGAGKFGRWFGEIVIGRVRDSLKVEKARLLNTESDLKQVKSERTQTKKYINRGHQILQEEKIARIPTDLSYAWKQQSKLANVVLDAIADFAKTEGAIINAGLLMDDIKQGIVSADNLHHVLPHPMRIMRCKIKGEYLLEFAQKIPQIDKKMIDQTMHGFGFRGKVFGKICLKGLSVEANEIKWCGEPIKPDREYELATIDYFSFLPFLEPLNTHSHEEILFPHFLRDVVGQYFRKNYPYEP